MNHLFLGVTNIFLLVINTDFVRESNVIDWRSHKLEPMYMSRIESMSKDKMTVITSDYLWQIIDRVNMATTNWSIIMTK